MAPMLRIARAVVERGHQARILTCDFGAKAWYRHAQEVGAELVPICTGGVTEETVWKMCRAETRNFFVLMYRLMLPSAASSLAAGRPDAVVVDFATLAGMDAAAELKVPLIINLPGPLSLLRNFMGLPDPSTQVSFLGLHFARTRLSAHGLLMWRNTMCMREWMLPLRRHLVDALLLVQTIWGLDPPQPVPPNVIVTGPLLPPAADMQQKLAKDHPELHRFLRSFDSQSVVYVTTGSIVELDRWQVEAIFHGLKQLGCRVVWSLKEDRQEWLPMKSDPDFFISSWTPQAEVLQDSAVKLVLTHCGWGGTVECMTAGKPVVAIPFFGDQPDNAKLLVSAGVGELLSKLPVGWQGKKNPYKPGDFTAATLAAVVAKVLADPGYTQAAARLAKASHTTGGAEAAAQHIEWVARFGIGHLRSQDFLRTSGTSPYSGLVLGCIIASCVLIGLIGGARSMKT